MANNNSQLPSLINFSVKFHSTFSSTIILMQDHCLTPPLLHVKNKYKYLLKSHTFCHFL